MKVTLLVDTMVTVKAGETIEVDEKTYSMLKALNRIVEEPKKEKKETATPKEEKKVSKRKKK